MTRKVRSNGRSIGEKYVALSDWLLKCPAWKACSVYERSLYIEIKRRYNGSNNGNIPLSHREAQRELNCTNRPILAAFAGLEEKGFIKPTQKGSFNWKTSTGDVRGRSTRWELTEYPADFPDRVLSGGTKDFMRWTPSATTQRKKTRYADSTPLVCPEHTISDTVVCPEHTIGMPRAYHNGDSGDGMVCPEHTVLVTISVSPDDTTGNTGKGPSHTAQRAAKPP
jgi:hypothetical protein